MLQTRKSNEVRLRLFVQKKKKATGGFCDANKSGERRKHITSFGLPFLREAVLVYQSR